MSYLVRFRKAEDITGDYISLALPGDTTTAVLPHLFPLTAYEVNVFAQYEKGDSFPLTGEETTLEGKKERLKHSTLAIFLKNEDIKNLEYSFLLQNKELFEIYESQRRRPTVLECHGKLLQARSLDIVCPTSL